MQCSDIQCFHRNCNSPCIKIHGSGKNSVGALVRRVRKAWTRRNGKHHCYLTALCLSSKLNLGEKHGSKRYIRAYPEMHAFGNNEDIRLNCNTVLVCFSVLTAPTKCCSISDSHSPMQMWFDLRRAGSIEISVKSNFQIFLLGLEIRGLAVVLSW